MYCSSFIGSELGLRKCNCSTHFHSRTRTLVQWGDAHFGLLDTCLVWKMFEQPYFNIMCQLKYIQVLNILTITNVLSSVAVLGEYSQPTSFTFVAHSAFQHWKRATVAQWSVKSCIPEASGSSSGCDSNNILYKTKYQSAHANFVCSGDPWQKSKTAALSH